MGSSASKPHTQIQPCARSAKAFQTVLAREMVHPENLRRGTQKTLICLRREKGGGIFLVSQAFYSKSAFLRRGARAELDGEIVPGRCRPDSLDGKIFRFWQALGPKGIILGVPLVPLPRHSQAHWSAGGTHSEPPGKGMHALRSASQ